MKIILFGCVLHLSSCSARFACSCAMSAGKIPAWAEAVAYTCASGVFPAAVRTTGTVPWTKVTHDDHRSGTGFESDSYKVFEKNQPTILDSCMKFSVHDFNVSQACCTSDLRPWGCLCRWGSSWRNFLPTDLWADCDYLRWQLSWRVIGTGMGLTMVNLQTLFRLRSPKDPQMMYWPTERGVKKCHRNLEHDWWLG